MDVLFFHSKITLIMEKEGGAKDTRLSLEWVGINALQEGRVFSIIEFLRNKVETLKEIREIYER